MPLEKKNLVAIFFDRWQNHTQDPAIVTIRLYIKRFLTMCIDMYIYVYRCRNNIKCKH